MALIFTAAGERDYKIDMTGKKRAFWPNPKSILEALSTGKSLRQIMDEWGFKYHVVKAYAKECPEWGEDYKAIVNSEEFQNTLFRRMSGALREVNEERQPTPKEKFLDNYGKTYKLEESRRYSGLGAFELEGLLDMTHEEYDEEFHRAFKELELQRKWALDDMAFELAPKNSAALQNLLKAEMPEKYKDKVTVEHPFQFTEAAEHKALMFLMRLFGGEDTSGSDIESGNGLAASSQHHRIPQA